MPILNDSDPVNLFSLVTNPYSMFLAGTVPPFICLLRTLIAPSAGLQMIHDTCFSDPLSRPVSQDFYNKL
ncbi:hypothetical protein BDR07DRAFT_1477207 [Suillus spraguei]|nr:hypothetical protein BDR07DRAFT_1477207 [Suillus spraguei]